MGPSARECPVLEGGNGFLKSLGTVQLTFYGNIAFSSLKAWPSFD